MTTNPPLLPARWLVPVLLWIGFAAVEDDASRVSGETSGETRAEFVGQSAGALPSTSLLRLAVDAERDGASADGQSPSGASPEAVPPIPLHLAPARGDLFAGHSGPAPSLRHAAAHPPRGPPLPIG